MLLFVTSSFICFLFPNMSATLYLNRNAGKTLYESITIIKKESAFSVTYRYDLNSDNKNIKRIPFTMEFKTKQELFEYLELTFDLLIEDKDTTPFVNVDLIIRCFPIICLKPNETTKHLVLKAFGFWAKF